MHTPISIWRETPAIFLSPKKIPIIMKSWQVSYTVILCMYIHSWSLQVSLIQSNIHLCHGMRSSKWTSRDPYRMNAVVHQRGLFHLLLIFNCKSPAEILLLNHSPFYHHEARIQQCKYNQDPGSHNRLVNHPF